MTDKIVVFTTCDSQDAAAGLARRLVEARVAACVNIVPGISSVYHWQGRIEQAAEWLLLIKSSRELFEELKRELSVAHTYEVPEVLALPVIDGSAGYLEWLERELKPAG
ncbi:MAG: divalent-cation tolerance protein CutA [Bryobacteraceae bacterium]|nr:divalent-cation tolerance protein CutA [Bryobacteraceae bacterium]